MPDAALATDRGSIALPGPTRDVGFGPRAVTKLDLDRPGAADRFVAIMRRVLWPHPSYRVAATFQETDASDAPFTLAILLPGRPCFLPPTDRLAIKDTDGPFVIPRSALLQLPVEVTHLDDHHQLVAAISPSDWTNVCARARAFAVDPG